MATVVLLGTLDTKGPEYAFLRDRVHSAPPVRRTGRTLGRAHGGREAPPPEDTRRASGAPSFATWTRTAGVAPKASMVWMARLKSAGFNISL